MLLENLKRSWSSNTDGHAVPQSRCSTIEKALSQVWNGSLEPQAVAQRLNAEIWPGCTAVQGQRCNSVFDRKVHGLDLEKFVLDMPLPDGQPV